jgi:hypothetical protein
MRMPLHLPPRPHAPEGPIHVLAETYGNIAQQQTELGDPLRCAACCIGRAGFGACVARCIATGQACDGGLHNCTPC